MMDYVLLIVYAGSGWEVEAACFAGPYGDFA